MEFKYSWKQSNIWSLSIVGSSRLYGVEVLTGAVEYMEFEHSLEQ